MKHDIEWLPEEVDNDYKEERTFKNFMKQMFAWFVTSSANRNNISLTIKALIPFLVLTGISDTDTLHSLAGSIGDVVVSLGETVTGLITIFGLCRKIYLSFKE